MVLKIWYLTNGRFQIDTMEQKGPATIILCRDDRDGVPLSEVQITVDGSADRGVATCVIAIET